MFDTVATVELATPGSYGVPPHAYRLPETTRLGCVRLQVADLARSLTFYEHTLGLRVLARTPTHGTLAAHGDDRALVEIAEERSTRPAGRALLGLYHFAILLPDRASLGRFTRHLAQHRIAAGAGDHHVSEALYLKDPDGLGIEVYADRPRDTWQRVGRELMISTDPVDIDALAAAADTSWRGMPSGTVIGHVHLHVGDLEQGAAFFSEALGFDRMTWRYPGALFLGAGGYHHHLGTNVWAGAGARTPTMHDARLLEWTIEVPAARDVADVWRSLTGAGHPVDMIATGELLTRDPWGTAVRVRATEWTESAR
ncbi:VOC family protein [Gemmatimonas sp.]|uniref:VOC family protein n=1 Tax=Gemmatimonas sp. TaxID=1962908 RepID=UPI00286D8201|nr:VOC family protein [Gemmatimonas sp.]